MIPVERFRLNLDELVAARYPCIQIVTSEEDRALKEVADLAARLTRKVLVWSTSRGTFTMRDHEYVEARNQNTELAAALEIFDNEASHEEKSFLVLLDPSPQLNERNANPLCRRRLRELCISIRTRGLGATILIISPTAGMPLELQNEIALVDFPLPSREDVRELVTRFVDKIRQIEQVKVEDTPALVDQLTDAALGLTAAEIHCALARTVVGDLSLSGTDVADLFAHKQQIIRKSGILDYIDPAGLSMDRVGGLAVLKQWLAQRELAFSDEGRSFGLAVPKGVLLTGIPGCGKSLSAKCVAATWRLPLIRLDLGKVFGPLVGSSEENVRQAIAGCEAVAPCVLWIDEIEKGLPRLTGHIGDSGTSLRVMGTLLTWMQEKTAPVFVFATANDVGKLVPEMLRKGRFDDIFFVDLPDQEERGEIIAIQLARCGRDPRQFDVGRLVDLSGPLKFGSGISLTGAEIEAWVNEALLRAFARRHEQGAAAADLEMADLEASLAEIVPFARLRSEEIVAMRDWAGQHAKRASSGR